MPELPEVETLRRELADRLPGRKISQISLFWPKVVRSSSSATFRRKLIGQKIIGVHRRAKILILELDKQQNVLIHLKMTGQLIFSSQKELIGGGHPPVGGADNLPNKFTRAIIFLDNDDRLFFNDLRKFGWFRLVDNQKIREVDEQLGPEPLEKNFTKQRFAEILRRRPKRTLKAVLLDQKLIAGLGNIYADESCFAAQILPGRRIESLKNKELTILYQSIITILRRAIRAGGTSTRDYRRSNGQKGNFLTQLQVYGRAGQACLICEKTIHKIKLAGRGTHFCPRCQK